VNRFARDYPGSLDGWESYHPEHLRKWVDQRRAKGLPDHRAYFTARNVNTYMPPHIGPMHTHYPVGGSSGLGAVEVALEHFGADKVVLCGIRMDVTPHFNVGESDDIKPEWREAYRYHARWRNYPLQKREKCRSVSGWTMEFLGAPDVGWLKG
jgi:hypothetical protein